MAHKLTVELTKVQYETLCARAERRGLDVDDNAALAEDLVTVWWGRLRALEKHQSKVAAVKADPIGHGLTFEPRVPLLAPDALDVQRLVALGVAPEPKANVAAPKVEEAPKAKARKAKGRKAGQASLPGVN